MAVSRRRRTNSSGIHRPVAPTSHQPGFAVFCVLEHQTRRVGVGQRAAHGRGHMVRQVFLALGAGQTGLAPRLRPASAATRRRQNAHRPKRSVARLHPGGDVGQRHAGGGAVAAGLVFHHAFFPAPRSPITRAVRNADQLAISQQHADARRSSSNTSTPAAFSSAYSASAAACTASLRR